MSNFRLHVRQPKPKDVAKKLSRIAAVLSRLIDEKGKIRVPLCEHFLSFLSPFSFYKAVEDARDPEALFSSQYVFCGALVKAEVRRAIDFLYNTPPLARLTSALPDIGYVTRFS